jgi:hypothetical protein
MAFRPFFSSEFSTVTKTATFTITRATSGPIVITPYPVSVTIPADRYFIGASTTSRNLLTPRLAAMNAVSGLGPFQFNVLGTSDNLGLSCSLSYDDSGTSGTLGAISIGGMNDVAKDLFWAIGFRNRTTISFTVVGEAAAALTDGIPRYSWFPKAFGINVDDYQPVMQQARSSRLTGSGSVVASTRQDDGVMRWWRSWKVTQVAAARCSYPKATSAFEPQWAIIAGLTTNPGDAALDKEDGWWQRTCAGQYRFVGIEDEADSTTPNWDVYRFIDDDSPSPMSGWKSLAPPNVVLYATAGALRSVEFSAVAARVGTV